MYWLQNIIKSNYGSHANYFLHNHRLLNFLRKLRKQAILVLYGVYYSSLLIEYCQAEYRSTEVLTSVREILSVREVNGYFGTLSPNNTFESRQWQAHHRVEVGNLKCKKITWLARSYDNKGSVYNLPQTSFMYLFPVHSKPRLQCILRYCSNTMPAKTGFTNKCSITITLFRDWLSSIDLLLSQ